jgi:hypothetical protein
LTRLCAARECIKQKREGQCSALKKEIHIAGDVAIVINI